MGCDGGSIPKRIELVKTRTRTNNTQGEKQARQDGFKYCTVSKEPLRVPVVMCAKGRLYNKEAILKALLDRKLQPEGEQAESLSTIAHIKGIKDLHRLGLTANPAFDPVDAASSTSPFICPVTGKEMNGTCKFVLLKGCGCVMAEQAIKQVSSDSCLSCGKVRPADDLLELNPSSSPTETADKALGKRVERKRPLERESPNALEEAPAYLPDERGYRPSLSRLATFRKTPAIDSLYRN